MKDLGFTVTNFDSPFEVTLFPNDPHFEPTKATAIGIETCNQFGTQRLIVRCAGVVRKSTKKTEYWPNNLLCVWPRNLRGWIPVQSTKANPTRYAAQETNHVLFVNSEPKKQGGFELAVFDSPFVHGTITVCAAEHFGASETIIVEVVKGGFGNWKSIYFERMPYNYDQAQAKLIEELNKAL